tara:strand:+ start:364 stop:537 length:174 start_codon:yes stop_codon:yes gene_type:complete
MIQTVKKKKFKPEGEVTSYEMTMQDGTYISVPLDETNTDYQAILKWVEDGNTIQEAD